MPELVLYGLRLLAKQFLGAILDIEVDQSGPQYRILMVVSCDSPVAQTGDVDDPGGLGCLHLVQQQIGEEEVTEMAHLEHIQHSHWLISYITGLSLVESFRVLKYFYGVVTPASNLMP